MGFAEIHAPAAETSPFRCIVEQNTCRESTVVAATYGVNKMSSGHYLYPFILSQKSYASPDHSPPLGYWYLNGGFSTLFFLINAHCPILVYPSQPKVLMYFFFFWGGGTEQQNRDVTALHVLLILIVSGESPSFYQKSFQVYCSHAVTLWRATSI